MKHLHVLRPSFRMLMSCRLKTLGRFFFLVLMLVFYCEFVHYYLVLLHCTWPSLASTATHPFHTGAYLPVHPVRIMVLSDTHLLGFKNGHWFDKLRREWQMERSFQSAMSIHSPDVVFVLGDLFDEGKWASNEEFDYHVKRFKKMFQTPAHTQIHVVVGNHDVGFHYMMTEEKRRRFEDSLDSPLVRLIRIKHLLFVLVNSMAMEGDNCNFCHQAESQLQEISNHLHCAKTSQCTAPEDYLPYSRPILLQHFPLFRETDSNCSLPDGPTLKEKFNKLNPKLDCLSESATQKLFKWLDPRLVISGHTHYGCYRLHSNLVPEWTVSSFSWRNRKNPAFLLMSGSSEDFSVKQCFLPNENTVIWTYIVGGCCIMIATVLIPRYFNNNNKFR